MFQSAAELLLYTHVTVDRLLVFLWQFGKADKLAKLRLVKTLRIEYISEEEGMSYEEICRWGNLKHFWTLCGLMQDVEEKGLSRSWARARRNMEIQEFVKFFAAMKQFGPKEVFPNLHTIVISSVFGGDYWGDHDLPPIEIGVDNIRLILSRFDDVLTESNVKHLCLRSMGGPLGVLLMRRQDNSDTLHSRTIHFAPSTNVPIPLTFGIPLKWVSDVDSNTQIFGSPDSQEVYIARSLKRTLDSRQEAKDFFGTVNLDVYCWTSLPKKMGGNILQLEAIMQKELNMLLKMYRRKGSEKDAIRYHLSATPPICCHCGTGVVPN